MDPFLLIGGATLILTLFVVEHFLGADMRMIRAIRRTRTTKLRNAPEGRVVRLCGTVSFEDGGEVLTAPVSGRPCVAWHVVVWRLRLRTIGRVRADGTRKAVEEQMSKLLEDQSAADFSFETARIGRRSPVRISRWRCRMLLASSTWRRLALFVPFSKSEPSRSTLGMPIGSRSEF